MVATPAGLEAGVVVAAALAAAASEVMEEWPARVVGKVEAVVVVVVVQARADREEGAAA